MQPSVIQEYYLDRVSLRDYWLDPFSFCADPWRPLIQTKSEHEKQVREQFEKALSNYFKNNLRYLDLRPNLVRSIGTARPEHYEWLAQFQCVPAETIEGVAKNVGQTRETVRDAVTDVAEVLGLKLKARSKGGRKTGSLDSRPRRRA